MPTRSKEKTIAELKNELIVECCRNTCNLCANSFAVLVPLFEAYDQILAAHMQGDLAMGVRQHVYKLEILQDELYLNLKVLYSVNESDQNLDLAKKCLETFITSLYSSKQLLHLLVMSIGGKCCCLQEEEKSVILNDVMKDLVFLGYFECLLECGEKFLHFLVKEDLEAMTQAKILKVIYTQVEKISLLNYEASKCLHRDILIYELFDMNPVFSLTEPVKLLYLQEAHLNYNKLYQQALQDLAKFQDYMYEHFNIQEIESIYIANLENSLLVNKYKRLRKVYAILLGLIDFFSFQNQQLASISLCIQDILRQADDFQLEYLIQLDLYRMVHKNLLLVMLKLRSDPLFIKKCKPNPLFKNLFDEFVIAAQKVVFFEKEDDKVGTFLALQEMEDSVRLARLLELFKANTKN